MFLSPLIDDALVVRRIVVRRADVVYVKGIFEASEGLAAVLSEPRRAERGDGGALVIAAPRSRERELDSVLCDLRAELAGAMWS